MLPASVASNVRMHFFNRLYEMSLWTFRSLSLGGYTVDCPHRERLGYGGDGHATMEIALTNFGMGAFYTKWLGDWRDVQRPDGDLPYTAPTYGGGGGPAWGGICVTLPWQIYLHYGDRRILQENYPTMQRWIAFLQTKSKDHLLQKWGGIWDFLGDWVPPGKGQNPGERVDERSTWFFNNCYYYDSLTTIAKVAELLGKTEEAAAYRQEAEAVAQATHKEFYNAENHTYANGDQLYEAMPLLVGIVPESLQTAVMDRLEDEIVVKKNGHIDTGIHGTYYLIKSLLDRNRNDLVFLMANQVTYPGWRLRCLTEVQRRSGSSGMARTPCSTVLLPRSAPGFWKGLPEFVLTPTSRAISTFSFGPALWAILNGREVISTRFMEESAASGRLRTGGSRSPSSFRPIRRPRYSFQQMIPPA